MRKAIHRDKILELRKNGKSYKEIQDILGCSKGTIAYHLGEGQKEKTKERTNRSRTLLKRKLWQIKENSGCVDCKEMYPHWMLDFDHRPEFEKIESPSQILHKYSWEKALQELDKCDIVCPNCHRIRTYTRNQSGYKNIGA
jgi:transposase